MTAAPATRLFAKDEVAPARVLELPSGTAAVFCGRCPGKEPGQNEDTAAVFSYADDVVVLVVADGVGGERSGAVASRSAVTSLEKALRKGADDELGVRAAILNGIEQADATVGALPGGGATTLAAVQVEGNLTRGYHVGDSGILVVGQRGRIKHQNIPHGPVGYAVEAGLLDAADALHHEELNIVSNVVGSADMRIEVGPRLQLARRDTVLLASDGLFDNLYLEEIVDLVRTGPLPRVAEDLEATCRRRMEAPTANAPSKPDDLTFILYRRT